MSPWEHFNGPFHCNTTHLLPLGCPVITYNKPATCRMWDFRGSDRFYVGISLEHYSCHCVIDAKTKSLCISDMVDSIITTSPSQPSHQPTQLSIALTPSPTPPQPQQPHDAPRVCPTSPRVASPIAQPTFKFTLAASPRVEAPASIVNWTHSRTTADNIFPLATPLSHTPVSSCTRSHTARSVTPAAASSHRYRSAFMILKRRNTS
jgi:hypothetical protein